MKIPLLAQTACEKWGTRKVELRSTDSRGGCSYIFFQNDCFIFDLTL